MKAKQTRSGIILIGLGLVSILILVFLLTSRRYTFRLTPADLESHIRSKFPYEKQELIFSARFTDPSVSIDPTTDQVILGVSATVSTLGFRAVGTQAKARGSVRYESSSGEIFLDSPSVSIKELEVVGLSERDQRRAREVLQRVLQTYLERKPIYRLKKKGPLKSLRVRESAIEIEVGF